MTIDRVVVDTNVLISSILSASGAPARLMEELGKRNASLIFSEGTFHELQDRLLRPKFDRYVSSSLRRKYLAQLDAVSEYVAIVHQPMGCRDADDDKFLETALLSDADLLVSGDKDLLDMHPFQGIEIYSPAAALERIRCQ